MNSIMLHLAAVVALAGVAAHARQVEYRAGETGPTGDVLSIGPEGVTVVSGGATAEVGWHAVLRVGGPMAAPSEQYAALGDTVWRARRRLARGDVLSAEALLEPLYETRGGSVGATTRAIAEVLAAARLSRGLPERAVGPWLTFAAGTPAGVESALHDPEYGLCPSLPPVFIAGPALRAWHAGPGAAESVSGRAGELAAWYLAAAGHELGLTPALPASSEGDDPGLRLVRAMVAARAGNDAQRARARGELREILEGASGRSWVRAWVHAGLGRSLIREDLPDDRLLGVGELVSAAALADSGRYLAGVCLRDAAWTLDDLGDGAGAVRVREHLSATLPGHPAADDERMRSWGEQKGGSR